VWAAFGQATRFGFVNYDDSIYVYDNPEITQGLTGHGIIRAFTHSHAFNWHPVTTLSHMLDCQVYGLDAGGHHLTNLLLHAITVLLLFLVLKEMTGTLWPSAFVAAVFAVHPLRVESVVWISERKDVLSGMFFMLTLVVYLRYVRRPFSLWRYMAVMIFYGLGLMSKPTLVTMPFVLLLLDYWPLGRLAAIKANTPAHPETPVRSPGRLIAEKIPLLILAAVSCLATIHAQASSMTPLKAITLPMRMANAAESYAVYLGQMFYPVKLAVLYPQPESLQPWELLPAAALLVFISAAVFILGKKRPWLPVGWLWYLGMLIPMIGIVQVGAQSHADRYTYLPEIGIYVMVAWTLARAGASWRPRNAIYGALATIILVACIASTQKQTSYWRDSVSLWTKTIADTSLNPVAQYNLGMALSENGRWDEAIAHYQSALELQSRYEDAQYNLGLALDRQGRTDEALVHYQMAASIQNDNSKAQNNFGAALLKKGKLDEAIIHLLKAVEIEPGNAEAQNNLGVAFNEKNRMDGAIPHFQKALEAQPGFAEAENNLGNAFFKKGKLDEALAHFQKAVELGPENAEAQNNLGVALVQKNQIADAITHLQKALEIQPFNATGHNQLGIILARKGRLQEAIVQFQQAVENQPDYTEAHFNLGKTLSQTGHDDAAVLEYRKVLKVNPKYLPALNNLAWMQATSPHASLRNGTKAVDFAEQAEQITGGNDPSVLDTLAAAYAEAGQFPQAIATAQKAESLARANGNTGLADSIHERLNLYLAHTPCRDIAR
jgi:tetratricopeptide (TPR) repeat protein